MLNKSILSSFFCTLIKNSKNSINPVNQHVAFGHYFPKEWTTQFIYQQLDPAKHSIKDVQLVLNRIGQPSGKVLLKFKTKQEMDKYISKYNQDFIMTKESVHRVVIQPFHLKTQQLSKKNTSKKTKHQVKVTNLDFDITPQELQRIAQDFGKVEHVQMHIRPNGLNNGLATVFFSKLIQAQDFSYFCDGLLYKQRKLKAQVIQVKPQTQKIVYLQEPTITLDSQSFIYKREVANQKHLKAKQELTE